MIRKNDVKRLEILRFEEVRLKSYIQSLMARTLGANIISDDVKASSESCMVEYLAIKLAEVRKKYHGISKELKELEEKLDAQVQSLPEGEMKTVASMKILSGYSFRKIADILGNDHKTVVRVYERAFRS